MPERESDLTVSEEVSDLFYRYQEDLHSGPVSSEARRPVGGGNLRRFKTHQIKKTLILPADEGHLSSPAGISAQQERCAVLDLACLQ